MGLIRVLPETIANKIAAGEVIERPASIVKELVENALDAGARSVDISIQHGGKSLIRGSDDGCGMDRQDAKLAFQRHATSKIIALEDLEQIASFGFRGEALPSIAAVSRTRLITRPAKEAVGTEVGMEGGNLLGCQDHACRPGTIVEVRDLFFNTPARRKFLKSDSTELGHIQELVTRLALPALQVQFTLKSDGKTVLDLPPVDRLLPRAAAVLGEETGQWLLELEAEAEGIRLSGLVGKPSQTKANRSGQSFFVNRRWVKSLPVSYALQAGYHGLIMHGRYPVAVLFLELDLKRVDVNVHPTKQEVKISDEQQVTGLVQRAVKKLLGSGEDLAPRLKPGKLPAMEQKPYLLKTSPGEGPVRQPAQIPTAVFDRPLPLKDTLRVTKVLGQIHNTFIVAETEEGLMVLDQHAAHERVMFEALLKNLQSGQAERQTLLLEEVLELHPKQRELFTQSLPMLSRVGFDIDEFGEKSFVIRSVPAVFGEINPVPLLRTFLEEREDGKSRTALDDQKEAIAALCACKRQSVKARDPLEPLAIRKLLERLAQCENPFTCPHGRPVFFTQKFSDLERQFKRI